MLFSWEVGTGFYVVLRVVVVVVVLLLLLLLLFINLHRFVPD